MSSTETRAWLDLAETQNLPPPGRMSLATSDDAHWRSARIGSRRQVGRILASSEEFFWLYAAWQIEEGVDLNGGKAQGGDFIGDNGSLIKLLREPLWSSYSGRDQYVSAILKGAAEFVENGRFKSTLVRDFFIMRILYCVDSFIDERVQSKNKWRLWAFWVLIFFLGAIYENLYFGAAAFGLVAFKAAQLVKAYRLYADLASL